MAEKPDNSNIKLFTKFLQATLNRAISFFKNLSFFEVNILFTSLGFFLCIALVTCRGKDNKIAFTEIQIQNKREAVVNFLNNRKSFLDSLQNRIGNDIKNKIDSAKRASKIDSINIITSTLRNTNNELRSLNTGNADTSLTFFLKYFSINRDTLLSALIRFNGTDTLFATFVDTSSIISKNPTSTTFPLRLIQRHEDNLMNLVNDYPLLGYWLFFTILQFTIWFMLIHLLVGKAFSLKGGIKNKNSKYSFKEAFAILIRKGLPGLIISVLFIVVFVCVFYFQMIDRWVISDAIFLQSFNRRMEFYSVPGYLLAVTCLTLYLNAAHRVDDINPQTYPNTDEGQKSKASYFKSIKSLFDTAFLFSAIVLSGFVMWVGIMFNTINSLETMRLYQLVSGRPFLNYDFVYLIGLFHTIILLIFYIPVKVKFNSLEVVQENKDAPAEGSKKIWEFLSESLGTILVTASPLITGILQKLITTFLQN